MTWLKGIIKNGNLTERVFDGLGVLGALIIWATAYSFEEWNGFWFWLSMCVGAFIGYFGAYGGLANKFGLSPFTNDPTGWRKAKESYKTKEDKRTKED